MPGEVYMLVDSGDEGSGASSGSEPRFLLIAQVARPVGLHGMVKANVLTDFPERFAGLGTVYLGESHDPHVVLRCELRAGGRQAVLQFAGISTRTEAEAIRGQEVWIPIEESLPLEEDRYYVYQVLGLSVETEAGEPLGVLTEVLVTGGNDVYVVSGEGREVLVPVLADVIKHVDLEARKMVVTLPAGLL